MSIAKSLGALMLGSMILVGAGCAGIPAKTPIEVSFLLQDSAKIGQSGAPLSDVYVVMDGLNENGAAMNIQMGTGEGCFTSLPENFRSSESLAEVNCFYAGFGELYQARLTAQNGIEVLKSEYQDGEKPAGYIAPQPKSIYTFTLSADQTAVRAK